MKITSFKIYQYSLPLTEPLLNGAQEIRQREGLMLHIIADTQSEGFGEIAPLPGRSQETFQESLQQLQRLGKNLFSQPLPAHLEKCDGAFAPWLDKFELKASVRFGVEMAVLNVIANARKKPLSCIFPDTHGAQIRINGLLQGAKREVAAQAQKMVEDGFTTLKLKVGRMIEEEITKVRAVTEVIEGRAILHVDANHAWNLNEAVEFGHEVGLAAVEYIEEPFADISQIPDFFMKTTIPVALDESLLTTSFEDLKSISGVEVLVIKPTVFGGIEKNLQMIRKAKKFGIRTVISSSFESGVGLLTLASIAGCCRPPATAGLDTLKLFKQDLLKDALAFPHGKLDIHERMIKDQDLRFDLLKEV